MPKISTYIINNKSVQVKILQAKSPFDRVSNNNFNNLYTNRIFKSFHSGDFIIYECKYVYKFCRWWCYSYLYLFIKLFIQTLNRRIIVAAVTGSIHNMRWVLARMIKQRETASVTDSLSENCKLLIFADFNISSSYDRNKMAPIWQFRWRTTKCTKKKGHNSIILWFPSWELPPAQKQNNYARLSS